MESWMPRNVAPGLNAAYSISKAFIKSTTTSEPYCGCFFSTLLCAFATLKILPWVYRSISLTPQNRTRAQRRLACRMNLFGGRRFSLLLLQKALFKKKLKSLQGVGLAGAGDRGLPYIQLGNGLQDFLYRWLHERLHLVVGKSPLQFVHFLGPPGRMDSQTDDTRSHFI